MFVSQQRSNTTITVILDKRDGAFISAIELPRIPALSLKGKSVLPKQFFTHPIPELSFMQIA